MIIGFVQARMGSSRLPGKVLMPLAGRPMLWHVWSRLKHAESLDEVVILTSDRPADDEIAVYCDREGVSCFRGPEDEVLARFYRAAEQYQPQGVARFTADCPLVDPQIVDRVVGEYRKRELDYCATSPSYTFPDGFGVEVFKKEVLAVAHSEATSQVDREHVTLFIRRNVGRFKVWFLENARYHPFGNLHLSVDDERDLELMRLIFEKLLPQKPVFHFDDVIGLLQSHPEWLGAHASRPVNEGFYESLLAHLVRPKPRAIRLEQSRMLFQRAKERIPSCTQTFSKGYTQYVQGVSPIFVERGEGGTVYDVDGNAYIDYPLGLGAISLGHCHPEVDEAVIAQVRRSPSHSLPHRLEVEVAERLCEIVPCAEMVRFGKNGSDVTAAAVRIARAVSGREKIACCGYHGWQDWYIGTTLRRHGVPRSTQELALTFPYGNVSALERLFDQHAGEIAAVIMEPVGTTMMPPHSYLQDVQRLVARHGALLIFDEIGTGFRLALGGAQEYMGVTPDLACIGKGMANGYPISAIVGRRDLMQEFDRNFFSVTFGGEAVSLAAALATLEVLQRENAISHMWILGRKLMDAYNYLARRYGLEKQTWCQGPPPRAGIVFKDAEGQESLLFKSIFQQECVKRGVLFNGLHKFCLMHSHEQVEYTIAVYDEAFQVLQRAYRVPDPRTFLEGSMLEWIFRAVD